MRVLSLAAAVVWVGACNCGPTGVDKKRFVCGDDAHCIEGFVCRGGECVPSGAAAGGRAGGAATAGGSVAGGGEAGGATAGGGEAGGGANAGGAATAGGGTAGGVATAGGGTAGGTATAGGGTAGGIATAGGGTAGGVATAGGGTAGGGTAGGGTAGGGTAGGGTAGGGTAGGAGPNGLVFTTTPPNPLLAGMCFAATIQARNGAVAFPVTAPTSVGLGVSLSGGVRFFTDSACSNSTSTTTIAMGSATSTFYVKPRSGTAMTVTATAPFASAQQMLTPRPVVRRGTCGFNAPVMLADGGISLQDYLVCPVAQTHTNLSAIALSFSASGPGPDVGAHLPTCWLDSITEVHCTRGRTDAPATVNWQTAELPTGLRVQAFGGVCPGALATSLTLAMPVNPATSFLLRSSSSSGMALDDDDSSTFRLTSPTVVRMEHDGCAEFDVQVVEVSTVSVVRQLHDGGMPVGTTDLMVSGLPAASPNTLLLVQARTEPSIATDCSLTLRGSMPSPTSVSITRNDGGCEAGEVSQIFWERVDFNQGANVQALTSTIPGAVLTLDVPISPVDTTRTLVLSSAQVFAGQAGAETSLNGEADEAAIRLELTSPTNVRLTRGDDDVAATLTFYVIEIEP